MIQFRVWRHKESSCGFATFEDGNGQCIKPRQPFGSFTNLEIESIGALIGRTRHNLVAQANAQIGAFMRFGQRGNKGIQRTLRNTVTNNAVKLAHAPYVAAQHSPATQYVRYRFC